MPAISVVIVTWNSARLLPVCLKSVQAQTVEPVQVVVVDNGSDDGTVALLEGEPGLTTILNRENRGFAAANNQGLRAATGELVLLLNYDVELAPQYLEDCSRHFQRAEVGSVTGKLLRPGGALIDSTGHNVYGVGWAENRGELLADAGFEVPEEVFGVCAAAALYRRTALESVAIDGEVLDESYFSYIEDVDLDWRLRWMGWRAWYEPGAVAVHHRSATGARHSAAMMRHILKNRVLTVVKNYDRRALAANMPGILAFTVVKAADFGRTHPSAVLGLVDAGRMLPRAMTWRRQIKAGRRVAPVAVTGWLQRFPWTGRLRRRLSDGR